MIYLNTNKLTHRYALAARAGLSDTRKSHFLMQLNNFVLAQTNELYRSGADKELKKCIKAILSENLSKGYHQLLILFSALKAIIAEFTSAFTLSFIELYEQITKEGK
ncbi:hypothetical protein [Campylobacter helveticus]|uniref:Uncharacterized protein n=1 Tax=Campylobacter helveticus TaxID=28898 RepID=A0AAX2UK25_9BACT|nr:hypothetical protein [Campylobacter helveticus]TNB56590.1 hypothetical protein FDW42_07155 [Campylobacter helveticus]